MVVLEVLGFFAATFITTKGAVMASVVWNKKSTNNDEEKLPESTAVTLKEIEEAEANRTTAGLV